MAHIYCSAVSIYLVWVIPFIRFKGNGKTEVMFALSSMFIIIIATFLYFVPTLIKIFENTAAYRDEELITMSQQWVVLNFIRLFLLMGIFIIGLIGLIKLTKQ